MPSTPRFDRAIVRPPGATFAAGLSAAGLGAPDLELALVQHAAYCRTLAEVGLDLVRLEPDAGFPDSTFVEDTCQLSRHLAEFGFKTTTLDIRGTDPTMLHLKICALAAHSTGNSSGDPSP